MLEQIFLKVLDMSRTAGMIISLEDRKSVV